MQKSVLPSFQFSNLPGYIYTYTSASLLSNPSLTIPILCDLAAPHGCFVPESLQEVNRSLTGWGMGFDALGELCERWPLRVLGLMPRHVLHELAFDALGIPTLPKMFG